ncbi:plexin domain-containing protein 1-like isoform X2 [Actinia tenebrosa]|uniref:Plexin domain-containing protein 1-like isoform X2 n=1 Tax=Actinia tenebrosa TaxID=6105 RepID=A0A6P8HL89_ACTTE|nr:plexin domain-containing protein 1-like isoform X2 [Actinia tenebrosa]
MKIGSLFSYAYFAVALWLFQGFSSVHSLDQFLQYQDARLLNGKLPIDRLDESHLRIRHRRDADPLKNATKDDHKYYKSIYSQNQENDWFELSDHPEKKTDPYLSKGFLKSKNFQLQFTFPYYGHPVTNATITTGGFLYVGYVETSLITSVMYIAPFMAPFNPSLNESAVIYYFSNATQFTVQWTNLHLSNKEEAGPFTFQASLYKDGRIKFAYKLIPLTPSEVLEKNPLASKHPVRVGISDAFFGYRTYYAVQYKRWIKVRVFYIYHKVDKIKDIKSNGSELLLFPVKNCIAAKSCEECTNLTVSQSVFTCSWCFKLQRCSDSFDRHRVEWIKKSCDTIAIKEYKKCSGGGGDSGSYKRDVYSSQSSGISTGAVVAIIVVFVVLVIVIGLGAWCFYAYTHPVTPSGLFLIELRNKPAQFFQPREQPTVAGATSTASRA